MNEANIYQPAADLQISDHIFKTKINDLYYITIDKHNDERGFFSQIIVLKELEQVLGHSFAVKQVNYSNSKTNVVRGMHAEGWNKLVTVTHGKAFSALADIRPDSETFKQVEYFQLGFDLNPDKGAALYVPQGLANSICALEGPVDYIYLVDKLYSERDPAGDAALSIFDPALNIQWPLTREQMILSQRDIEAKSLEEILAKK